MCCTWAVLMEIGNAIRMRGQLRSQIMVHRSVMARCRGWLGLLFRHAVRSHTRLGLTFRLSEAERFRIALKQQQELERAALQCLPARGVSVARYLGESGS